MVGTVDGRLEGHCRRTGDRGTGHQTAHVVDADVHVPTEPTETAGGRNGRADRHCRARAVGSVQMTEAGTVEPVTDAKTLALLRNDLRGLTKEQIGELVA